MRLKFWRCFWLAGISLLLFILVNQKINLVTADLGRHLKNGELILQGKTREVWQTNFYSYTYPQHSFVNHHWGSGVVFFLVWKAFGFGGLSIFFSLITLLTFGLFFSLAWRKSRFSLAFLSTIVVLPLLVSRVEVRPEIFSYFLAGIFWWILSESRNQRKLLWLLPFLEFLWINLHIYFILGFFLIGTFIVEELVFHLQNEASPPMKGRGFLWFRKEKVLLRRTGFFLTCFIPAHRGAGYSQERNKKREKGNWQYLVLIGGLCLATSFLNPAGFKGVVYPWQIFNGYGYRLLENQSIWFLDKIVKYPPGLYFKITLAVLLLSWIYVFWRKKAISVSNLLLTFGFSLLGGIAIRNFTLFGYFSLPLIASNFKEFQLSKEEALEEFMFASAGVFLIFVFFLFESSYWIGRFSAGFGLAEGNEKAAEFFLENRLKGPIFNNYDIGSYLIYFLYPQKVFVDNRPEAYPKEFFEKVYIPMQENEEEWQKREKEYNFNSIFFSRYDLTPWGQNFLIQRIRDPDWVPVYVDDWTIIFLRKNEENQEIIQKFALPREMFSVRR